MDEAKSIIQSACLKNGSAQKCGVIIFVVEDDETATDVWTDDLVATKVEVEGKGDRAVTGLAASEVAAVNVAATNGAESDVEATDVAATNDAATNVAARSPWVMGLCHEVFFVDVVTAVCRSC